MVNNKRVCIIGAGSSGMVAAKVLSEKNIGFDCFEAGSTIGGNWKYQNDNGMSAAYKSLHINTSKQLMSYGDFPMPDDYPNYPSHELIYRYFENYVDHFGFRDKIIFNTKVTKVEKLGDNHYRVHTDRFPPREYEAVMVANGHHWDAKQPKFPGEFSGTTSHTHSYKTFDGFEGKRVLIVGIGNSAVDIACELTTVADKVTISTRSGAYIMPKYLFGVPTDHLTKPPFAYAPIRLQRAFTRLVLYLNIGNQKKYGMPVPNRPLLAEHPTISQEILNKVGHGKIDIQPNIERLNGNEVVFVNGKSAAYDHIIYATGYRISFPFFGDELFKAENNEMPLYRFVVDPENPGLYFLGFIQPLGSVMPLVELQAEWIAQILLGNKKLPSKSDMEKWIADNRKKMRKRYGDSARHTMEVDFFPYKQKLRRLAGV